MKSNRNLMRQYSLRFFFVFLFVMVWTMVNAQWSGNPAPKQGQTETYSYRRTSTWGSTVNWSPAQGSVMSQWLSTDRLTAYANIRWNSVGSTTLTVRNGTQTISSMTVEVQCPVMYAPTFSVQRTSDNPAASNNGCVNASFQINATIGSGGSSVRWYNSSSDTQPFYTGSSLNTGALSSSTTYWISTFYLESGGVSVSSSQQRTQEMQTSGGLKPPPGGSTIVCESSKIPVTINIYPAPVLSISVETPTICSGSMNQIFLYSQGGLGSEVSTNWWASYPPDISGGAGSGTTQVGETLTVIRDFAQPQTVTYYASITANGCTSAVGSAAVTVIPIPNAAATPQAICTGETTSIAITTPKGVPNTTYTWTASSSSNVSGAGAGSGSSISQTLINNSATSGTATYTITPKVGFCSGPTATVVATVKPRPVLTVNNSVPTFCSGLESKIYLSNNGVSNTTYGWTTSATNVSGSSSSGQVSTTGIFQDLTATANTSGTVVYSISSSANGCSGSSGSATVTVKPLPTASASASPVCSGSQVSISVSNPNGVSGTTYSWSPVSISGVTNISGGTGTPIVQYPIATTSSQGSYYYAVTPAANGCNGPVHNVQVLVNPIPPLPGGADVVTQTTAPVVLTATGAVANEEYRWYSTITSTPHIRTGANFTTGVLSQTYTSYFVSRKNTITGCEGPREEIRAVYAPPLPLSGESPVYASVGFYIYSFTADGSLQNAEWVVTNGEVLSETNSSDWYTRTARVRWHVPGSGEVKLKEKNSTWVHAAKSVSVICPSIGAPTLSEVAVYNGSSFVPSPSGSCGPAMIRLTATPGTNANAIRWYETATGGTGVDNTSITTNGVISATKHYWIISRHTISGCESPARVQVAAAINPIPSGVPAVTGNGRFEAGTLTIFASGTPSGGSYRWINNVTGENIVADNYTTPPISNDQANYLVTKKVSAEGCEGPTLSVNIDIEPAPTVSASESYIAHSRPVTLTASSGYDSYTWKNESGATVETGSIFNISTPGNYQVTVTKAGITGSATSAVVSIGGWLNDQNVNFIIESVLSKSITDRNSIASLPIGEVIEKIQYFDGLGRLSQTVQTQASPSHKDIVIPVVYDPFGREAVRHLPFTGESNGGLKTGIIDEETRAYIGVAAGFYEPGSNNAVADDVNPWAETAFEPSPLNRVLKQGAPGEDWQPDSNPYTTTTDHSIKYSYETNVADEVLLWTYIPPTPAFPLGLVKTGAASHYDPNQLYKTLTKDEDQHELIEFKDKQGKVILKKVAGPDNTWAMTYYIYNDFGSLVCVLQPEGVKNVNDYFNEDDNGKEAFLQKWAFRYRYDERMRMTLKQVPGADSVVMVYDNRDRLVLTQDGNQRDEFTWLYTKYDEVDRPIITGIYSHGSGITQKAMRALISTTDFSEQFDGTSSNHGYSNNVFPTSNIETLTVAYYDDYVFKPLLNDANGDFEYKKNELVATEELKGQDDMAFPRVANLITATKTRILNSQTWLWTVNYYDDKYRLIQSTSDNYKNGFDRVTNVYDFAGKVLRTKTFHSIPQHPDYPSLGLVQRFSYDHAGRPLNTWHRIDTSPEVLLSSNEYNELGELVTKGLHQAGSEFLQTIDYRYNIRGWLKEINDPSDPVSDDLFKMRLHYNDPTANGGDAQYNGNISEAVWKSAGLDKQSYGYYYDPMNRIMKGSYYNLAKPLQNGYYDETIGDPADLNQFPAYDLNGNIQNLLRKGKTDAGIYGLMDRLHYDYGTNGGNRLMFVSDTQATGAQEEGFKEIVEETIDYGYDENGNLTKDENKGITGDAASGLKGIQYNHLNLPWKVSKSLTEYIVYTYDATGRKLAQQVSGTEAKTTEYLGGLVFENNALQFVLHPEGRAVADTLQGVPDGWEYQYFLKDHLGNTRVVFSDEKSVQEYKVTFEDDRQNIEMAEFPTTYPGTRSGLNEFDHTDAAAVYNKSLMLHGGQSNQVGLAKSFTVSPGDVFDLEVYAKYLAPSATENNLNGLFSGIVSAFSLGNATTPLDGAAAYSAIENVFQGGGPWINSSMWDDAAPKAYLNYLLFDENFALVDFGFDQVSTACEQDADLNPVAPHDYLSLHVKVEQKGYLYVYLSNEQSVSTNVYFDDMKIVHYSAVEQVSDYYPFGLTFNSYQKEQSTKNSYLYNQGSGEKKFNTERVLDLGLNIDLTKYRTYDFAIGRWWQADPMGDSLAWQSPYNGMDNDPIRYNDPYGDCPACWGALIGFAVEYTSQVVGNVIANKGEVTLAAFTNVDAGDLAVATAVGAATGGLSALSASFTKTAIVGGIASVNALGEGVKASTDVNVNLETGDVDINSIANGGKSVVKAAVEFATGNLPGPDVSGKGASEAANAAGEYVTESMKGVLEEGINAQVE